jgi:hypothetical protein
MASDICGYAPNLSLNEMGFEVKRMACLLAYKHDPHLLLAAISGRYFEHMQEYVKFP